jgi:undecaprenyl-diphosphatase
LIAVLLMVLGVILYWVDRRGEEFSLEIISLKTSFLIGLSQALAIMPGISRSGITITMALIMGMTREAAARFSFLLSAPIIFGAAIVKLPHIIANPSIINTPFIVGMIVSCITGLASIGFLLRYLQTKTFLPFVLYRFILGAVILIMVLLRQAG